VEERKSKSGMENRKEYDEEPVSYCTRCLSLRVMRLSGGGSYCDTCGCTDIGRCDIEEWKRKRDLRIERERGRRAGHGK